MGWRTIYIEESDRLHLFLDNLKVQTDIGEITIPLDDIRSLIIDNIKTSLTVGLINKCIEHKVNIVICDNEHLPCSNIVSLNGNFRNPIMLKRQLEWQDNEKAILWQLIVKAKIRNQIEALKIFDKSLVVIDKLTDFMNEVELFDFSNREGLSAKMYFRELFGKDFIRGKDGVINAGLNYGYSIFRSLIARSLISKGLNTNLGIFHKGPNNFFNLADDIIEIFRPIVDIFVYKNLSNVSIFTREHRLKLIELTHRKLVYKGQQQTIPNVIDFLIDSIIFFFETGDVDKLSFFLPTTYDI